MPTQVSHPGVYIEEVPSGVRTITGVATSITAFLGRAVRGPVNEATTITSYADFERTFGGLKYEYPMSYTVRDFYLNGGGQAVVVRLFHPSSKVPAEIARLRNAATALLTEIATAFETEMRTVTDVKDFKSKADKKQADLKRKAFEISAATDRVWRRAVEAGIPKTAKAKEGKDAIKD